MQKSTRCGGDMASLQVAMADQSDGAIGFKPFLVSQFVSFCPGQRFLWHSCAPCFGQPLRGALLPQIQHSWPPPRSAALAPVDAAR
eukprot:9161250-Pyramimonas_sp.AAC.1